MDNIIEIRNVSKAFSNHKALDDISLSIPRGKIYGLLGPNGAGKTTLIRIINRITAPDSGEVIFDGHRLAQSDIAQMGYLPEERGLYKKMRVGEQAIFFARLKGLSRSEATKQLKEWFDRLEIASWWDKKVEELSKGMAQKVQFIVTVLHKPRLLIFDEPFSGFDPINVNVLKAEILRLRDEGATVIFSTHNMASVEELCDNITLINKSRNILSGNVAEIRRQYSGNGYDFVFDGDVVAVKNALAGLPSKTADGEKDSLGRSHIFINLNSPDDLKTVVSICNDHGSLCGFNQVLPSMNEIFIRTVQSGLSANSSTSEL